MNEQVRIPLAQVENEGLEFKSRDALRDPSLIGRTVVAMLNASGGTIWIGIAETEGRAAAIENVENPEAEIRSLQDHLVATLEPSPTSVEVRIASVRDDRDRAVLRVAVEPGPSRKPYAQVRGNARHYWLRVGARTRVLSREEIRRAFVAVAAGTLREDRDAQGAKQRILEERDEAARLGGALLWLRLQPERDVPIEVQDPGLTDILRHPEKTGNRETGWVFASLHDTPRLENERVVQGDWTCRRTEIRRDGGIQFTIPIGHLQIPRPDLRRRNSGPEIDPLPLVEYPLSVLRLASRLYREASASLAAAVWADLALLGVRGWALRPYSPFAVGHDLYRNRFADASDLVSASPLRLERSDVLDRPDRCTLRLLVRVYEAFGYDAGKIQLVFEGDRARLPIPA